VPALDYNTEFKTAAQVDYLYAPDMYRTSDHDPVLLGVALEGEPVATCSVKYTIHGAWPGGFISQVWVTNLTEEKVKHWKLEWAFPGKEKVTALWNGSYKQKGANVTVKNLFYNGTIKPGEDVTFGFLGSFKKSLAEPTEFWLNGEQCLVE
jgi:cellulase/cellobiase CelA1